MQNMIDIVSFVRLNDVFKWWSIVSIEGWHLSIPVLFLSNPVHDLNAVCDFEELVYVFLNLVESLQVEHSSITARWQTIERSTNTHALRLLMALYFEFIATL